VNVFEKKYSKISEVWSESLNHILNPEPSIQIPSWPTFTRTVGGLRKFEYTILCGGTGTGKTAFVANLVLAAASQGVGCFVASVETGRRDFVARLMSAESGSNFNSGLIPPKDKFTEFVVKTKLSEMPIYLTAYENRVKNEEMMEQVVHSVKHDNTSLVVLDNLNFFLEVRRSSDMIIEMDRVTHDWIILAKELPAHVIMIMHPKKTDNGLVLSEFDIKGSSTAVQEAHNVLLFNRVPEKLITNKELWSPSLRSVTFAKCRRMGNAVNRELFFEALNGVKYVEATTPY
jgi:replicative DNA helicase